MTTKDRLLKLFDSNKGQYFSGEELARRLDISRAAVWKAVNALRDEGYRIEAATNRGYCLSRDTDILSPQGIRKYLGEDYPELNISVLGSVGSTNSLLREKAESGEKEGAVLIANGQSSGRGRYGREFYSPDGSGLYMSVLLRPEFESPRQSLGITTMAAAAMCEAIEDVSELRPGIKWVNDIYLGGKKVCGILTEGAFGIESGNLEYAVLGLGLNVYEPAGGFPDELAGRAGALFAEPAEDMKNRLAAAFLRRFMDIYRGLEENYIGKYRAYSLAPGRKVTVIHGERQEEALALGIDDDCRLLLRYDDGREAALSWGEISIEL
ncbi:MAG: biotin--[acetyl-CoA-carboxylase] ligase [Candidatus Limivicinus sp.]|jgi:BirA family biotin operon repressor/biotin-[acetyl-CoA-carboxylase] ligase